MLTSPELTASSTAGESNLCFERGTVSTQEQDVSLFVHFNCSLYDTFCWVPDS